MLFREERREERERKRDIDVSINRGVDKKSVVHKYSGILAIKKNEISVFATVWMDLEGIMQPKCQRKANTV